jgi:hypothetical protein
MGWRLRFTKAFVFCLAIAALGMSTILAQDSRPPSPSAQLGGPQDWSNRHVIYTRNGSVSDMRRVQDDPRFLSSTLLRYIKEHPDKVAQTDGAGFSGAPSRELSPLPPPWDPILHWPITPPPRTSHSKVDWSISLGPKAGMAVGESPAVYTANYSKPSCTNDFIVYTVDAAPSVITQTNLTGQANLIGLTNLYSNFNNTGFCSGNGPSFMFSYAIGTGGSPLSPVISLDGTKVAWIESTNSASYLHVTIWAPNYETSATSPVTPSGAFSNGSCTTAGSACDYSLEYTSTSTGCPTSSVAANTHSDLYVDYSTGNGYISANNGFLYHIKNVFSTTANPSVDFCIAVNAGFEKTPSGGMSGPVYDFLLNEVFLTDSETIYGYAVNASSFELVASYQYGNTKSNYNYQTGPGPLLDMFNNFLYVFSTYDKAGKTSVTQLPTSLASATPVELGSVSTNTDPFLFYGAFDNNYFTYGPKSAASTLYTCGTDTTNTAAQDLFSISFNPISGIVNTTPAMSNNRNVNQNSADNGVCSPLTEFYDGSNDRLFVGMGQPDSNVGSNFVSMWNIKNQLTNTSGPGNTMPTYSAFAQGYLGGTTSFAVDNNDGGTSQAENVYFSTELADSTSTQVNNAQATATYNVYGIYSNGQAFSCSGGLDDDGNAYSANLLNGAVTWNGFKFNLGPNNSLDAWQDTTIALPAGSYSSLSFLAAAVNGNLSSTLVPASTTFTVTYTDNTTTTITQSVSDWYTPQNYPGESIAAITGYRNMCNGQKDDRIFNVYGYSFALDPSKTVKSFTLPPPYAGGETADNVVVVLALALGANCGGPNFCAVKLSQSALE